MRIVVDARIYGPRHGGLGRYVQQLVMRLPQLGPNDEWFFLMSRQANDDYINDVGQIPDNVQIINAPWRWYTYNEQIKLPNLINRLKPDLIHFPHFNVPVLTRQTFVVTVHDLIVHHFPSSRATTLPMPLYWLKWLAYRYTVYQAVRRAKKIIVPTEFVKEDLLKQYRHLAGEKISVVNEGVTIAGSTQRQPAETLPCYNIRQPFLLYVGNAYPHKDILTALRAFKILRQKGLVKNFVHVWRPDVFLSRLQQQAREQGLVEGVIWPGYVPDDDLSAMYQAAACYVFSSRYEGFGLPPLEAQNFDCPVVAAKASCLPEILGDSVLWFKTGDAQDLADSVERIILSPENSRNLFSPGKKMSCAFLGTRWLRKSRKSINNHSNPVA